MSALEPDNGERLLTFAYGTLKKGQPNHHLLETAADGACQLLGTCRTVDKWPLVIATRCNLPYMLDQKGLGKVVYGELWSITPEVLEILDHVEGHPYYYTRELLSLVQTSGASVHGDGPPLLAWTYILKAFQPWMLDGPFIDCYDTDGPHGRPYNEIAHRPYDPRPDVKLHWDFSW